MARKTKTKFNVDKLKICFKQPEGIFETLYNSILLDEINLGGKNYISITHSEEEIIKNPEIKNNNLLIPRLSKEEEEKGIKNDFTLYVIRESEVKKTDNKEDMPTDLQVNILLPNEGNMLFGKFNFTNSKKYEGLCWFTLSNKALYKQYDYECAYSFVYYLNMLAVTLELYYNNITEIEIACDSTSNLTYKIRKLIKDHENFEMIFNGKKIDNPNRKIENYYECFGRSRAKLIPYPTLYFEQVKKDAPLMRVYNKSLEIADNNEQKNYIAEWDNFGNSNIHRAEVRLKNESVKQAWQKYTEHLPHDALMKQPDGITQMLDEEDFLEWLWVEYTNRMITFNDPNGQKVTIHDLVTA